jgi:hypothetical protein
MLRDLFLAATALVLCATTGFAGERGAPSRELSGAVIIK